MGITTHEVDPNSIRKANKEKNHEKDNRASPVFCNPHLDHRRGRLQPRGASGIAGGRTTAGGTVDTPDTRTSRRRTASGRAAAGNPGDHKPLHDVVPSFA